MKNWHNCGTQMLVFSIGNAFLVNLGEGGVIKNPKCTESLYSLQNIHSEPEVFNVYGIQVIGKKINLYCIHEYIF